MLGLELNHAVGLLAFGKDIIPIGITREYEKFHDELGRLDANQGSTSLYDSILSGAEMLLDYEKVHLAGHTKVLGGGVGGGGGEKIPKRIFVLTDGEDNSSKKYPWEIVKFCQENGIIIDAGKNHLKLFVLLLFNHLKLLSFNILQLLLLSFNHLKFLLLFNHLKV